MSRRVDLPQVAHDVAPRPDQRLVVYVDAQGVQPPEDAAQPDLDLAQVLGAVALRPDDPEVFVDGLDADDVLVRLEQVRLRRRCSRAPGAGPAARIRPVGKPAVG